MSSLWTPAGEHEVPRDPAPLSDPVSTAAAPDSDLDDAIASVLPEGMTLDELSPEQRERAEEMVKEMIDTQSRLLEADASAIVANHAMGLYELAALHLSQHEPKLAEAAVAIDALGAIVDRLAGRLGEAESTLRDALGQLRLGFVQVKSHHTEDDAPAGNIPTGNVPTGNAPTGNAPTGNAPTGNAPTGNVPTESADD